MAGENQQLVVDLCQNLHSKGLALIPGTGVAMKQGDLVFIPPSDVHLERLEKEDIFTFNSDFDSIGNPELNPESTNPCHNISAYAKLFLKLFQDFDCGCVFYAQPKSGIVVGEIFEKFYKIKNNQLITQISNGETKEQYPWTHELKVPIIANPDDQTKLFEMLEVAFEANPQTNAVIIKGNGLVVCGDTWQETKLMFETFLQLFEASIELEKIGNSRPRKEIVKMTKIAESKDIEIIKAVKPAKRKQIINPRASVKQSLDLRPRIGGGSTRNGRETIADINDLTLRRKKMTLARLRISNVGRGDRISAGRRNAASFMQNNYPNQSIENRPKITIGNGVVMDTGIGNVNNMNMGMNQDTNLNMGMNQDTNLNMGMNQGTNMNMGMNQYNNMNMGMNQVNNMNMIMNQGNQGDMNMGVGYGANMGMGNMNQQMLKDMNEVWDHGMDIDMRIDRSSGLFGSLARGRGYSRARGNRSSGAKHGNVKERLGFKSNISVDPSELKNSEDY